MDPRVWTVDYIWKMNSYDILFDERLKSQFHYIYLARGSSKSCALRNKLYLNGIQP